jgi:hypothetical protein
MSAAGLNAAKKSVNDGFRAGSLDLLYHDPGILRRLQKPRCHYGAFPYKRFIILIRENPPILINTQFAPVGMGRGLQTEVMMQDPNQDSSSDKGNLPGFDPMPPSPGGSTPEYSDWRTARRNERHARQAARRAARDQLRSSPAYGWIAGGALILLGIIFMAQNLGAFYLQNWWALFILIPAVASFAAAWNSYHANGRLTASGRGSLVVGGILVLLAAALLFGLDFGLLWPVILIVGGVVVLLNALLPG